jgi:gamma-glutamylcyclotransferase (GGCT)/AIG2-like uncharacterized protein YtfP
MYFAYGSNMEVRQMLRRCPGARLVSSAAADGWRFRITAGGVATIVPENGASVHGVIWLLAQGHRESLDRYEGVALGLYRAANIEVRLADGASALALVYVAAGSEAGVPRAGYLQRVVAAAAAHNLPPAYLEELRGWLPDKAAP